ncbi:Soj-like protein [Rosistilla ulvae]|uniref:Soj-like protein n=2 Tax=Rosistilla ulvae TaxID=1930277 RepID=A0A517M3C6_9BACT|nr:Soj-like protein [Rosistilla ulvae]
MGPQENTHRIDEARFSKGGQDGCIHQSSWRLRVETDRSALRNKMGRILCVANQKGGVGKTTTAVNLAAGLARGGYKTLLVDMDPQCNATSALGIEPAKRHPLIDPNTLRDSIRESTETNLDLLPGSRSFQDVDQLAKATGSEAAMLRRHLETGLHSYDHVLIDCPPSLGTLTRAALAASTEVLMPIQCEYFAMEGLTQMIHVIREAIQATDGRLTFGGILLTMYDPRLELTHEVDSEVREFFGEIVFDTVVPRDVALTEAPSHGENIFQYSPRSRGAYAYTQLCMEVLGRD